MKIHGFHAILAAAGFGATTLSGCNWEPPGKPKPDQQWQPPQATKDFAALNEANCRACHGDDKTVAPAIRLNNPIYAAIVPKEVLRKTIAEGVPGTMMPGFSTAVGENLTDEQINILVENISHPDKNPGSDESARPPYAAPLGDRAHGEVVFNDSCAKCHGAEGKAGSVIDPDYLHLVSDQYLRTVVIAGRPELGMPGYDRKAPDKPLTSQDIADVVSWLASHRVTTEQVAGTTSSNSLNANDVH